MFAKAWRMFRIPSPCPIVTAILDGGQGVSGGKVELNSDVVRHISKRHPEFSQWDDSSAVINGGEMRKISKSASDKDGVAFVTKNNNEAFVVIAEEVHSKKHGTRLVVRTAFKDSTKAVENWLKQ